LAFCWFGAGDKEKEPPELSSRRLFRVWTSLSIDVGEEGGESEEVFEVDAAVGVDFNRVQSISTHYRMEIEGK
jgi:hypothetical protein